MSGDWRSLIGVPQRADCCDLMRPIPDGVVNLVFADPDYNIGVFRKMPPDEYLAWCEEWIAEASRVLAANGALWVSHSRPDVLVDISRIAERYGRGRKNWITWDKYNGASPGKQHIMNRTKLHPQGKRSFDQDAEYLIHHSLKGFLDGFTLTGCLRSFQPMAKYLIYHVDDGEWEHACGKLWSGEFEERRGFIFEPLRLYLEGERRRAGIDKVAVNVACGFSPTPGGMASRHYFSRSQWQLPTLEHYEVMQRLFNEQGQHPAPPYEDYHDAPRERFEPGKNGRGPEYLRADYEYLRADYEDLRYTFNNPGKVSSVWQIPPAPRTWHPTPKPEALLERIILATSNEGDLVLDPFGGSFTTARICQRLGRQWISGDVNPEYVERARAELERPAQMELRCDCCDG